MNWLKFNRKILEPRIVKRSLTVGLLLLTPLLSGCWDRLEIEDRAVILAIAIDKATKEDILKLEDKPGGGNITSIGENTQNSPLGNIKVTVQIAVPGRIPLGPGGGTGGPSKPEQKPVWIMSITGQTINEALVKLQQRMADRLFFGHLRVIVVSEEVAKLGIADFNDFFRRQPQIRRTVWMTVSDGMAEQFLTVMPQLERVPTLYLQGTLEHGVKLGKIPNDFVGVFWSATSAKGQQGYLPYVRLTSKDSYEVAGLAYFLGDRMVGTTSPLEVGYFMGIKSLNPGGYSVLLNMPEAKSTVMFHATHRNAKIKMNIVDGIPHFTINIQLEGDLSEKSNEKVNFNIETIKELQSQLEKGAMQGYKNLIKKTQEKGSDIFGFGEIVRARQPAYWKRNIRTKENWIKMYKQVTYEFNLNMRIRRIGAKSS
ncbi:MAG: germination protein Ger(x)C family [Paenibacillaceae bacterium]|jgi:spore germination protein KC|nr:germination protein Ger(x)C family [Paenibacillaceae bacterium]